jgi:hypothetical protein
VLNLCLAVIWLVVAAVMFGLNINVLSWLSEDAAPLRIPASRPAMGWLALCLCLYNVARWWITRRSAGDRSRLDTPTVPRRFFDQESRGPAPEAEIRFTDNPPPPGGEKRGGLG